MLTPETVLQSRYRVLRQLGQGGMGAVYEAIDERLDSTVALKETFFGDERLRKQFEREARLLARMHHPALPRVSDHFSEGDGQFLVMQFIPGDDLAEMSARKRGPFSAAEVTGWADQLLDALDYLHTQDPPIIHRDIKPQNLKVTARGQIILLDFGLAKGQASEVSRITTSASIFGYTPNYAPLEQIQGLGTDARSDIYALAATLYHLITGVKPPDALTRAAAIVNGQPDPLRPAHEVNTALSPSLSTVLDRALAQNRDQRYGTAAQMRQALRHAESDETVTGRSEANTVLFPTASPTVSPNSGNTGAAANRPVTNPTVQQTGDTTIVAQSHKRPRAVWPIAVTAVVLVLAGLGGLYAYQRRNNANFVTPGSEVKIAGPSPAQNQPTATPAPASDVADESKKGAAAKQQVAAEEKVVKKEKAAKSRTARDSAASGQRAAAAVDEDADPPGAPEFPEANGPTPPRMGKGVNRPGGVRIRNLRDGTQIITGDDGMRIVTRPNGEQRVFRPANRLNRRRIPPTP